MNNYKITLTPIDWFFFGGETTFGSGKETNYYAQSRLFPQQSTIIGMLRYEILKKNGLLHADSTYEKKVLDFIGYKGFDINTLTDKSIGCIKSVSPVFLQKEDIIFYKAPLCNDNIDFEDNTNVYINGRKSLLPIYKDTQKGCWNKPHLWLSLNATSSPQEIDIEKDVFLFKTKIGITNNRKCEKSDHKNGFYKGKYCHLKNGFSFVFFTQIDTDLYPVSFVYLGAERSLFKMTVEKQETNNVGTRFWEEFFNTIPSKAGQLMLLSEALVPDDICLLCNFMFSDTISFRYINRTWSPNKNYALFNKLEDRSLKYNMLTRGSVLFYDENKIDKIKQKLNNNYLKNFGYNFYK